MKPLNRMSKKLLTLGALCLLLGAVYLLSEALQTRRLEGPKAPTSQSLADLELETTNPSELPSELNIEMVFYTQAPHSNWDYPWQEACEEASTLLVANLYKNMNLDRDAYNEELLRLVDWEMETFGAYEHTTVEQTVQMIEENYGLETKVHLNPSFEDIQSILAKGNLIISPMAGKELHNPNFKNGGPVYHMFVVKGYNAEKKQIVTAEVGTRMGEDYVYSWDVFANALHDWHAEDIHLGEKKIIEVVKP